MSEIQTSISVEQALRRLVDGNERFLRGELRFPGLVQETLKGLQHSQHPYATILGCSDSRDHRKSSSTVVQVNYS